MYEDFPILTSEDYMALNNKYEKEMRYNKTYCINEIVLALNECKEYCFALVRQANSRLTQALNETKMAIETISANMSTISDNKQKIQEVKQTNIFNFIKNLTKIGELSFEMFVREEKEYCKKIASANIKLVNESVEKLLSALENSNFKLFRFM